MKYTFAELVDIEKVQKLMESYCQAIGLASAIIDFDGNVLVGTNWQPLCTDFHRVNEESCKMCIESDTVLANRLQEGEEYAFYECRNGLLEAATPIIIDGEHLVNLFVGQFLIEPPDQDYFRQQAQHYKFEVPLYMAALAKVPVISREKAEDALNFMAQFTTTLGEMGLQQKRQLEYAERLETEVAERRRLEQDLRKLSRAVEQSANTVVITDTEGYIEYVNPKFVETSGYSREEAIGQHTRVMKSGATPSEEYKGLWETITAGKEWQGEFHNKRKNGELFWELASISPIKDEQGHITHFLAVKEDITARKQAEAELENRLKELHALQRLMTREGWQEFRTGREQVAPGYLFNQAVVRPVEWEELDIAADGKTQAESPAEGIADKATGHKAITKPLAVSGESIGILGIYDDDPNQPLSPEDQAFLDEVAAQVAEALERARLLEQSRTSLAETELLYDIAQKFAQTDSQQEMFEFALSKYLRALNLPQGGVLILDEDKAHSTLVALRRGGQAVEAGSRLPIAGNPAMQQLIKTKEPVIINDARRDELLQPVGELTRELDYQSMLLVPIIVRGEVIGALEADSTETLHKFTAKEVSVVRAVADQLGMAMENQRLLVETQTALAEVEATQRRYTLQAWETYRAKRAVMSYEQDREGVPPLGEVLPPEVNRAVSEKKPLAVALPANGNDQQTSSPVAQSSLVVPLTVRNEVIGVLGLQDTDEARDWTPEEIALVEAIGEQLAQAAEQLRLFDETQQRAARERRVAEIGDKIRATQSLEEALQVAIKEIGLSLKAPQTSVQLEVE